MDIIDQFVSRYRREYDYHDQAARLVAQTIEGNLQSAGIRAIVTSRAKSPVRLEAKVRQRNVDKNYQTIEQIFDDIVDLAGVRVALYFPAEREQVGKFVRQLFVLKGSPKEFPESSKKPTYKKRFSGYWSTHYRVHLRDSYLNETQKRYLDAVVEIQVASVLMHAWAEVNHDLVYKPLQGLLSEDEYAILDELNGLVMAGEIALERLQRAGENRVAEHGNIFSSHYDLASFLLKQASGLLNGPIPEALLGRVDLLYKLLVEIGQTSADDLQPYLASITTDFERRPLAEQIIDQLIAENKGRYDAYNKIKFHSETDGPISNEAEEENDGHTLAIGRFLSSWIDFEKSIREFVSKAAPHAQPYTPPWRELRTTEIYDQDQLAEIDSIRRLRNNLVHGIEVPSTEDIKSATKRLDNLLNIVTQQPKTKSKRRRPRKP